MGSRPWAHQMHIPNLTDSFTGSPRPRVTPEIFYNFLEKGSPSRQQPFKTSALPFVMLSEHKPLSLA